MYTNGGGHDAPRYKNISRVEKLTRTNHLYLKWDIFIRGNTLVFVPIDRIRPFRISSAVLDEDVRTFEEEEEEEEESFLIKHITPSLRARRRVIENIASPLCVFA